MSISYKKKDGTEIKFEWAGPILMMFMLFGFELAYMLTSFLYILGGGILFSFITALLWGAGRGKTKGTFTVDYTKWKKPKVWAQWAFSVACLYLLYREGYRFAVWFYPAALFYSWTGKSYLLHLVKPKEEDDD